MDQTIDLSGTSTTVSLDLVLGEQVSQIQMETNVARLVTTDPPDIRSRVINPAVVADHTPVTS